MIHLSDSVYNILKWFTLIVLPATGTAYYGLAGIWGFPYAEEVTATIIVTTTLLGALIGVSTVSYNNSQTAVGETYHGTLVVNSGDPDKDFYDLQVDVPIEDIASMDSIRFKINNPSSQ